MVIRTKVFCYKPPPPWSDTALIHSNQMLILTKILVGPRATVPHLCATVGFYARLSSDQSSFA